MHRALTTVFPTVRRSGGPEQEQKEMSDPVRTKLEQLWTKNIDTDKLFDNLMENDDLTDEQVKTINRILGDPASVTADDIAFAAGLSGDFGQ
jgi:hypothetical protein